LFSEFRKFVEPFHIGFRVMSKNQKTAEGKKMHHAIKITQSCLYYKGFSTCVEQNLTVQSQKNFFLN
jgi:hypothetical protein